MNGSLPQGATLGVIGDVHLFWDDEDTRFFNESGYDLLLFVGDLAGYDQRRGLKVARSLSSLKMPALCIPGNHDGLHAFQLGAEVLPRARPLRRLFCAGQGARCERLDQALGPVEMVGYSRHRFELAGVALNIIVGRPHSIGGKRLACLRYLQSRFGVDSVQGSAERIASLVDACDEAPILFLAHNGPAGLGDRASSIWGCDFRKQEEDWGDEDLAQAISYAQQKGRKVLGAVAGHMHRRTKSGKRRPGQIRDKGILYVNAAEVPRHRRIHESGEGPLRRHHVRLSVTPNSLQAEDVWV